MKNFEFSLALACFEFLVTPPPSPGPHVWWTQRNARTNFPTQFHSVCVQSVFFVPSKDTRECVDMGLPASLRFDPVGDQRCRGGPRPGFYFWKSRRTLCFFRIAHAYYSISVIFLHPEVYLIGTKLYFWKSQRTLFYLELPMHFLPYLSFSCEIRYLMHCSHLFWVFFLRNHNFSTFVACTDWGVVFRLS